jgi:hypothetical protein
VYVVVSCKNNGCICKFLHVLTYMYASMVVLQLRQTSARLFMRMQ